VIKELIKLANTLDKRGLRKEADYLDALIKKTARCDTGLCPTFRYTVLAGDTPSQLAELALGNHGRSGEIPQPLQVGKTIDLPWDPGLGFGERCIDTGLPEAAGQLCVQFPTTATRGWRDKQRAREAEEEVARGAEQAAYQAEEEAKIEKYKCWWIYHGEASHWGGLSPDAVFADVRKRHKQKLFADMRTDARPDQDHSQDGSYKSGVSFLQKELSPNIGLSDTTITWADLRASTGDSIGYTFEVGLRFALARAIANHSRQETWNYDPGNLSAQYPTPITKSEVNNIATEITGCPGPWTIESRDIQIAFIFNNKRYHATVSVWDWISPTVQEDGP
jgi:hypothetical protein